MACVGMRLVVAGRRLTEQGRRLHLRSGCQVGSACGVRQLVRICVVGGHTDRGGVSPWGDRRAPAGPIPCTARNALLKASPEAQPKRTAMSCSGSAPASTDEAATVMRRRQTYSETGMPAGTENIRRKWYCEVRVIRALPGRMPPVDTAVRAP